MGVAMDSCGAGCVARKRERAESKVDSDILVVCWADTGVSVVAEYLEKKVERGWWRDIHGRTL